MEDVGRKRFHFVFNCSGCLLPSWEASIGKGDYVINRAEEELKVEINMLLYNQRNSKRQFVQLVTVPGQSGYRQ